MSLKTTNYEFLKPELTDPADITAINGNWDKVDATLKSLDTNLKESVSKLQSTITCGTASPSGGKDGDVYIQLIEE